MILFCFRVRLCCTLCLFFLFPSSAGSVGQSLEAPGLIAPAELEVFLPFPFDEDMVLLSWHPVDGAEAYQVHLRAFDVVDTLIDAPEASLEVFAAEPETYFWRVRAIGPGGEEGPWSLQRRFIRLAEVPTPTRTPRPTGTPNLDVSGDGVIDGLDPFLIASRWKNRSTVYDLTRDDWITEEDFIAFLAVWRNRENVQPGPTPLFQPPRLVTPEEGEVFHRSQIIEGGSPGAGGVSQGQGIIFSWSSVEGADRYDLRFEGPSGSSLDEHVLFGLTATQLLVRLPIRLEREDLGTYLWQVRSGTSALDPEEGTSYYSNPRTFFITDQLTPTPTATPIPLSADVNLDGRILPNDLFLFSLAWRSMRNAPNYFEAADLNRSGEVEPDDLLRFSRSRQKRLEEFLDSPELLLPADGATLTRQQTFEMEWLFSAVPNSAEYQVELLTPLGSVIKRYISESGKPIYNIQDEADVSPGFLGVWKWRIRAIGQGTGRVSPWSEQRSFTVTGG